MYIIGFNGPPYSGKDTLANMVAHLAATQQDPVRTESIKFESLSMPLRSIAYAMVGREWMQGVPDDLNGYSEFKQTRFKLGHHTVTGRQLMIDVSESFLKKLYGIEIMADLLRERTKNFDGLLLVRDCGFQVEVNPLIRWVGSANFLVARVHRPGHTFDGDSRENVYHPDPIYNLDIENRESLGKLKVEAKRIFSYARDELGWKI
jgi:hypothetical protein